jgi:hypothetical protein
MACGCKSAKVANTQAQKSQRLAESNRQREARAKAQAVINAARKK